MGAFAVIRALIRKQVYDEYTRIFVPSSLTTKRTVHIELYCCPPLLHTVPTTSEALSTAEQAESVYVLVLSC